MSVYFDNYYEFSDDDQVLRRGSGKNTGTKIQYVCALSEESGNFTEWHFPGVIMYETDLESFDENLLEEMDQIILTYQEI